MTKCLESGLLRGRPYGGVMTLISNRLRKHTVTVHCDERFVIIKIYNYLIVNVYFPCSGTDNRLAVCADLLTDIWSWRDYYRDCKCIIAGDYLDSRDEISRLSVTVHWCVVMTFFRLRRSTLMLTCQLIKRVILTMFLCLMLVLLANLQF